MAMARPLQPGDLVEVFSRMPYGQDNGHERLDSPAGRWLLCPSVHLGTNRPRTGWSERWLPATVVEPPPPGSTGSQAEVRFHWDVHLWFDWASGERIDSGDPSTLLDHAPPSRVRLRSSHWNMSSHASAGLPPPCSSEMHIGGVPVAVSFIVFRWGAAKIPVQYDSHSWGRAEGSTVSARFIQLFFNRAVTQRLSQDYEVLTVFIQHSDEFAGISPDFLASLCRGRTIVSLYFLWPVQGQQTYGDKLPCTAAYVDSSPFFDLVARMEAAGIVTRWPHHLQLWRCLAGKDWVPALCMDAKYHIPLTTRVPKSLILVNPLTSAQNALATLRLLQAERRTGEFYAGPAGSDWAPGGPERCVAKLGYSYEGVDVRMVQGEEKIASALQSLVTQPGYTNDCVYLQQRVNNVDVEARCFVLGGEVVGILYTRFARIDPGGYVRDYEKASSEREAMEEWFEHDEAAWSSAQEQIRSLSRRWHHWLLTQSSEPTVSVRIDYLMERLGPGKADVWTGEVGELGYSMGGIDPASVFHAVLDTISPEVRSRQRPTSAEEGSCSSPPASTGREREASGKRPLSSSSLQE